jgi:hypothetical protein
VELVLWWNRVIILVVRCCHDDSSSKSVLIGYIPFFLVVDGYYCEFGGHREWNALHDITDVIETAVFSFCFSNARYFWAYLVGSVVLALMRSTSPRPRTAHSSRAPQEPATEGIYVRASRKEG